MFEYKNSEQLEKLSNAELDQYKADLKKHEAELQKTAITEEVKAQLKSAQDALQDFLGKEIANQLTEIKSHERSTSKTFYEALDESIKKNSEAIKALKNNRQGNVKLEIEKAPQNMTFPTNTTGRIGRSEGDPNFYGIVRKPLFISQIISITPTNARTFTWIDKTGYEGAPAMTAEGTLKPQADWNLVEKIVNPKKVAVIVTASKEMLDDIDNMTADINMEIDAQVRDVMEQQWLNGDGTGENISGILLHATPFAAGSLANTVKTPNNSDVLRAAINQVRKNNFMPNYILMSTSDATAMDLEKNANGTYLLPPFMSADNTIIKGIPIIETNYIPDDTFVVGDFTKYRGKMREGLTLDVGYKTGDWEKNFVSFLGEARFFGYIPTNHYGAIVTGSFTAAKTALAAP